MRGTILAAAFAILLSIGLGAFVHQRAGRPPVRGESEADSAGLTAPSPRHALHPTAAAPVAPDETTTNDTSATNLYARCSNGETPYVSREQLEPFLAKHHRGVDALLGSLRASGDDALLREAKEKFPDDPRVQFAAAFKTDSAEERQQWLEKFKQSDSDNSLPNYLLAGEHLQSGKIEAALQELAAAGQKSGFDNHLLDFVQDTEEAYHAAGYSEAEAKAVACSSALLPELAKLKQVAIDLVALAKRYDQAGDGAASQAVREMGLNLGRRLDQPGQTTLIQELVGSAIERIILNSMSPDAPYGASGQTVKDFVDAMAARRKAMRELTTTAQPILSALPDAELIHFYDRLKMYGEVAAIRWVAGFAPGG